MNHDLRRELLAMATEDQRFRTQDTDDPPPGEQGTPQAEVWRDVDERNTAKMKAVIARHGWPGRELVGDDGAEAAWLLVQHADHDPAFQQDCLTLLAAAVSVDDAAPANLAYLTDRIAVAQDRPQTYGTQLTQHDAELMPLPIAAPEYVDERRKAVGLPPLADYLAQCRADLVPAPPRER